MNPKGYFGFFAVFFLFLVIESNAEVVKFEMCAGYDNQCTIKELRVDPCKEAATNKPCKLKKGEKGIISFDFVPNFAAEKYTVMPYWASITDLPFIGMDQDACKYSTCPLVSGTANTYSYDLVVSKTYPSGTYPLKWKLIDDNGDLKCCFKFTIKMF